MFVCVVVVFVLLCVVNPDDHRKDRRRGEAELSHSLPGVIDVCFPMFTFFIYASRAATQR
jgi:hypothetical protein